MLAVDDYCMVFCMEESYNAQLFRKLGRIEKHMYPESHCIYICDLGLPYGCTVMLHVNKIISHVWGRCTCQRTVIIPLYILSKLHPWFRGNIYIYVRNIEPDLKSFTCRRVSLLFGCGWWKTLVSVHIFRFCLKCIW